MRWIVATLSLWSSRACSAASCFLQNAAWLTTALRRWIGTLLAVIALSSPARHTGQRMLFLMKW
eukprot:921465-Rhodomonas_salina.1